MTSCSGSDEPRRTRGRGRWGGGAVNVSDIQSMLDEIKAESGDPEVAHCTEDDMHFALLQAIADGTCENPQECARLALTSTDIDFPRWCA